MLDERLEAAGVSTARVEIALWIDYELATARRLPLPPMRALQAVKVLPVQRVAGTYLHIWQLPKALLAHAD